MGDRWVSSNLMRSTYVWLPLTISGTTASMVSPSFTTTFSQTDSPNLMPSDQSNKLDPQYSSRNLVRRALRSRPRSRILTSSPSSRCRHRILLSMLQYISYRLHRRTWLSCGRHLDLPCSFKHCNFNDKHPNQVFEW